jgi:dTDP-4-dehydrorhamnose 3,5-epimerase
MIDGVILTDLKIIRDGRGEIRHFMSRDRPPFDQFGEVYFSQVYPNTVKAWHEHKEMTLNYVCVVGVVEIALFDARVESATHNVCITFMLADHGPDYKLLTVPPGVWNGFRAPVGWAESVLIANCATLPHDQNEIERHPLASVDFDWGPHEVSG